MSAEPLRTVPWAFPLCLVLVALPAAWAAKTLLGLGIQLWHPSWLAAVWFLVVAPALEEFALRPLLQQGLTQRLCELSIHPHPLAPWLRSREPHVANALVCVVFVLMHAPSNGWLSLLWACPALALGELWRQSQKLSLCTAVHAWFNLSLLGVSYA